MIKLTRRLKIFFSSKGGFSLIELIFVAGIYIFITATVLNSWMLTYRGWSGEKERTSMRIDLLKAIETVKSDTRLSSITYMSFYPAGGEYYTGVSMPQAVTDKEGFLDIDEYGHIIWKKTVFYYVSEADGKKSLKKAVIDSWDYALDGDERYELLRDVIDGKVRVDRTEVVVEDLLDAFRITASAWAVDFYANTDIPLKGKKVMLGMAMLSTGQHDISFTVIGKNKDSKGYVLGIDAIYLDPCDSQREAEYYLSSAAPSGAWNSSGKTATVVNDIIWGNSNYVRYEAAGEDDFIEFTDYYDLNRDSTFAGATLNNIVLTGDTLEAELEIPSYRDEGEGDIIWEASNQESGQSAEAEDGRLPAYPITIRTTVRNDTLNNEGFEYGEKTRADLVRVKFSSSSENPLKIQAAYITRRNGESGENGFENLSTSGKEISEYHLHQQVFFRDQYDGDGDGNTSEVLGELWIPPGTQVFSEWVGFPILLEDDSGHTQDYFVTFCVPDLESVSFPSGWSSFEAGRDDCIKYEFLGTHSYFITEGDYGTMLLPAAGTPVWEGVYTVNACDQIFIAAEIDGWKKEGIVESRVIDTEKVAATYSQLRWSETSPVGTEVSMQARSSSLEDMSDATNWADIPFSAANPQTVSIGSGRYAQYRATLSTELYWKRSSIMDYADYIDEQESGACPWLFPSRNGEYFLTEVRAVKMDNVELRWPGGGVMCTLKSDIAKSRDGGRAVVMVDGKELINLISVYLSVGKQVKGIDVREEAIFEIKPRNTFK